MKEETIEEQVAATLLQDARKVVVGDKEYMAAPPSIATLAKVSALVSKLPRRELDKKKVMQESLASALDAEVYCQIAAVLILGAKKACEIITIPTETERDFLWGLFKRKIPTKMEITRLQALAEDISEAFRPSELTEVIANLLRGMELGDFFGLTTFLTEVNLLRPTKVEK